MWKIEQKFLYRLKNKGQGNIPRDLLVEIFRFIEGGILSRDSFIKNLSTRPRVIASKSLLFSRRLLITSNLGRIAVYGESERNRGSSKCVRLRKRIIYPFKLPAEKAGGGPPRHFLTTLWTTTEAGFFFFQNNVTTWKLESKGSRDNEFITGTMHRDFLTFFHVHVFRLYLWKFYSIPLILKI